MKKLLPIVLMISLFSCSKSKAGHECAYDHCPFKGQAKFISEPGCVEGSDCYYLDIIHFENPALNYDQCEDLLFKNNQ